MYLHEIFLQRYILKVKIKLCSVRFAQQSIFMILRFWRPSNVERFKMLNVQNSCVVISFFITRFYNLHVAFCINKDRTVSRDKLCIQGNSFFFTTKTGVFSSVTLPQQNSRFPRNESPDSHRAQPFPCHLKTSVA